MIRRVLVAVDASEGSLLAAEAAARIAARLEAELEGLFVEDARILRLASSPLAREVDTLTAARRQPESRTVERQLRLQGLQARERLRRIAEGQGIRWTFTVARGAVATEIAAAAERADLVSVGPAGWSLQPQQSLGAVVRALLERKRARTLLLRRAIDLHPPLVVLFDGSREGEEALALGARLAGDPQNLRIVLLTGSEDELRAEVERILGEPAAGLRIRPVAVSDGEGILLAIKLAHPGALLVPATALDHRPLRRLLDRIDYPTLVFS